MMKFELFMDDAMDKKQGENKMNEKISFQQYFILLIIVIIILFMLVGCGPSTEDLEAIDYTPLPGDDWQVSTPAEQELDPMLVAELYLNAAEVETTGRQERPSDR